MSKERYFLHAAEEGGPWHVSQHGVLWDAPPAASCPTREAAEAARRLLSGEALAGLRHD